jgi:nucleotide-binding universal stress UspA family protein
MTSRNNEDDRRIVVGVDGSPCSEAALRWAIAQARLTGATIEAIDVWQEPMMYRYSYGLSILTPEGDTIPSLTEKILQETVEVVVAEGGQPVEILTRTVGGPSRPDPDRGRRRSTDVGHRQPRTQLLR